MEENIYQKAIEQLILEGYTILQITTPQNNNLYFNVYRFQEGYQSSAQSVDFHTVEGINITDFLNKNSALCLNRVNFLSLFNRVMDEGILIRCQFSTSSIWYKWSSSIVNHKEFKK